MEKALPFLFLSVVWYCLFIFFKAFVSHKKIYLITFFILTLQIALGTNDFYLVPFSFPPRFLLLFLPSILCIVLLFFTKVGKYAVQSASVPMLILLHTVRVPVELILHQLYIGKKIPIEMTYLGYNYDILIGFSAILIYVLVKKNKIGVLGLKIWNFIGFLFVLNIVIISILSAQTPFQQIGFLQPNTAVLTFPYNLLPSIVVSCVIISHLALFVKLKNTKHEHN